MSEYETIREQMKFDKELWRQVKQTQACKLQAKMFLSWVGLGGIPTMRFWCPVHQKEETIMFECGLSIERAIELLSKQIPEHSKEVKKERIRIEEAMKRREE